MKIIVIMKGRIFTKEIKTKTEENSKYLEYWPFLILLFKYNWTKRNEYKHANSSNIYCFKDIEYVKITGENKIITKPKIEI